MINRVAAADGVRGRRRQQAWNIEMELCAAAGRALAFQPAVVVLGDAGSHGQAQACAAADALGGKERLEHMFQDFGGNPRTGVADAQADKLAGATFRMLGGKDQGVVVGRGSPRRGRLGNQADGFGQHRQGAALRHGVLGVHHQLADDLLHLAGINIDQGGGGTELHRQLNRRRRGDRGQHVAHAIIERHLSRLRMHAPGKHQELPGQFRGALPGRLGVVQQLDDVAAIEPRQAGDLELRQGEVAEHHGEQVVEIVSDAAGQLGDGAHLLRLPQLGFEVALFGDVPKNAENALDGAVAAAHRRLDDAHGPQLAALQVLFLDFARHAVAQDVQVVGAVLFGQPARIEREVVLTKNIDAVSAEAGAERLIDGDKVAFPILEENTLGKVIEQSLFGGRLQVG